MKNKNAEVLGVSVDSKFSHQAWMNTPLEKNGLGQLSHPLASDMTKSASRDYGVLNEELGIAYRGLFIIDPDGIIRYQVISDLPVGRSVNETVRVLDALQSGGLCPINWKKGDAHL